jgi:tight adherence protein C
MMSIALLVTVLVAAVVTAGYAYQSDRRRRSVLMRMENRSPMLTLPTPLLPADERGLGERLGDWLSGWLPAGWTGGQAASEKLVQAGFDIDGAPAVYGALRAVVGFALPVLVFLFGPARTATDLLMYVGLAAAVGLLGPPAVLDRLVQRRREVIRRGIPDALDLLVVCVEAGVSLDSAMLRVARDLSAAHPVLTEELLVVIRKVNAGIPRSDALYGLWERTGIEELRGLASNMVQSERWGTSIAKVLRINAETLRRKRRQTAEKKAAQAALKMMGPLILFLLPALFVVILGPVALRLTGMD